MGASGAGRFPLDLSVSEAGRPGYARAFRDRVSRQARLLAQFPRMGQMVLEVGDPDVRQLRVQKFRLIYRVKGEDVEMYAILPGDTPLNL